MSLIELKEKVCEEEFERVIMAQMSYSQKQNPKMRATHMSKTMDENGWSKVRYYRKKS